jgi:hypothetical protein
MIQETFKDNEKIGKDLISWLQNYLIW